MTRNEMGVTTPSVIEVITRKSGETCVRAKRKKPKVKCGGAQRGPFPLTRPGGNAAHAAPAPTARGPPARAPCRKYAQRRRRPRGHHPLVTIFMNTTRSRPPGENG